MAFPNSIEVHFRSINATPAKTEASVSVYRVSDGGVVDGVQQFNRVLWRSFDFRLDAGWEKTRLVDHFKARLAAWNVESGANVNPANFICDL